MKLCAVWWNPSKIRKRSVYSARSIVLEEEEEEEEARLVES